VREHFKRLLWRDIIVNCGSARTHTRGRPRALYRVADRLIKDRLYPL
jgi:hypothetical protein